jgi:hypothetical protein
MKCISVTIEPWYKSPHGASKDSKKIPVSRDNERKEYLGANSRVDLENQKAMKFEQNKSHNEDGKKKCELFQQAAQRTLARNKNNKTSEINRQIFFSPVLREEGHFGVLRWVSLFSMHSSSKESERVICFTLTFKPLALFHNFSVIAG